MIHKSYFYKPEAFESEKINIFSQSWLFACTTDELPENNDFISFHLLGNDVVLQNFKGKIQAFQNVCPHRFNKIQTEPSGNRPFVCGYHSWGFNSDGIPIAIPHKDGFTFSESDKECNRVKKFETAICGRFVFFKIGSNDIDLEQYLGSFYNKLEMLGNHFGSEKTSYDIAHKANWKLLVENVLECYHCSTVHRNSLYKSGYGKLKPEDFLFDNKHSEFFVPKYEMPEAEKPSSKLNYLDSRSLKHNSFHHIFIYPNLFLASTEGIQLYIGVLKPQHESLTTLTTRFFSPDYTGGNPVIKKAYRNLLIENGLKVIEEDRSILENIQQVIQNNTLSNGYLNEQEVRINKFHEIYENDMKLLAGSVK